MSVRIIPIGSAAWTNFSTAWPPAPDTLGSADEAVWSNLSTKATFAHTTTNGTAEQAACLQHTPHRAAEQVARPVTSNLAPGLFSGAPVDCPHLLSSGNVAFEYMGDRYAHMCDWASCPWERLEVSKMSKCSKCSKILCNVHLRDALKAAGSTIPHDVRKNRYVGRKTGASHGQAARRQRRAEAREAAAATVEGDGE